MSRNNSYAKPGKLTDEEFAMADNECYSSISYSMQRSGLEINPRNGKKYKIMCFLLLITVVVVGLTIIAFISFITVYWKLLSQKISNEQLIELESQLEAFNKTMHYFNGFFQQYLNQNIVQKLTGLFPLYPASSCAAILLLNPSSPSGYYWVQSSNNSAVRVHCDMIRTCGNITGGWMRVVFIDMSNNLTTCPLNLCLLTTPLRTCRMCSMNGGCSQTRFSVAVNYSSVCGRIKAYQSGSPEAFSLKYSSNFDGVSLTYSHNPKIHIWTFAAASQETSYHPSTVCPCIDERNKNISSPPSFYGTDYFCDTAATSSSRNIFYSDDPLWDGYGCTNSNVCCSFNNPPWFYKQLSQTINNDIDMTLCRNVNRRNEDINIELVELYVRA